MKELARFCEIDVIVLKVMTSSRKGADVSKILTSLNLYDFYEFGYMLSWSTQLPSLVISAFCTSDLNEGVDESPIWIRLIGK